MVTEPTLPHVTQQISAFEANPRYYGAERAVELVFHQWPQNSNYEQVLVKVIVLNRLYSTNIYDPYTVAQHIVQLKLDAKLAAGGADLVPLLAKVALGGKERNLLSFATKYCSWHNPDAYQIYDSYVDWLLWQYQRAFRFGGFRRWELREYDRFVSIIDQFKRHFGLESVSRKAIDKYLWIEGLRQWSAANGSKAVPDRGPDVIPEE